MNQKIVNDLKRKYNKDTTPIGKRMLTFALKLQLLVNDKKYNDLFKWVKSAMVPGSYNNSHNRLFTKKVQEQFYRIKNEI